ncbi:hypothetical protein GCM10009677_63340 [Sphaerisporangium rubeum]
MSVSRWGLTQPLTDRRVFNGICRPWPGGAHLHSPDAARDLIGFGRLVRVGIEGTGVYGDRPGPAAARQGHGGDRTRPARPQDRRFQAKSDPIDAIQAAKTTLAGERTGA